MTKVYQDKETLKELYWEEEMSLYDIADKFGVNQVTIMNWMDKFGLERRERTKAIGVAKGSDPVPMKIHQTRGHRVWQHRHDNEYNEVAIHRLTAVAWFGMDAVRGKDVHHKNKHPLDNRQENLRCLTREEHSALHAKEKIRNSGGKIVGTEHKRISETVGAQK